MGQHNIYASDDDRSYFRSVSAKLGYPRIISMLREAVEYLEESYSLDILDDADKSRLKKVCSSCGEIQSDGLQGWIAVADLYTGKRSFYCSKCNKIEEKRI